MTDRTPRLEIKQLFEKRAARDSSKLKAYNQILNQIYNRIYTTSQLAGNSNCLAYTVPPFILGLPSIDLEDCIIYIVHMLRQGGFEVKFTYPNLLFISWKHYESEYNKQHNPIVQAMAPTQNTSKKGAGGKRGIEIRGPGLGPGPGPGSQRDDLMFSPNINTAPPRSAMEYRPPDAFIQNLSKPLAPPPAPPSVVPRAAPTNDILADLWKFT
jgi:hypothetical protein|uniref:Uncharacterized protein n=1 Tax=viral metagenome TaxID=1070528 RepID=A0A6C0JX44_9ZZZZ